MIKPLRELQVGDKGYIRSENTCAFPGCFVEAKVFGQLYVLKPCNRHTGFGRRISDPLPFLVVKIPPITNLLIIDFKAKR